MYYMSILIHFLSIGIDFLIEHLFELVPTLEKLFSDFPSSFLTGNAYIFYGGKYIYR